MQILFETSTISDGNMSLKHGPKDVVLENRNKFICKQGLDPTNTIVMDSNHSDVVTIIDATSPSVQIGYGQSLTGDTFITNTQHPLLLTTADCLPVGLYDSVSRTIALIHLSRHTFCLNILSKTIQTLKTRGVDAANIATLIGPHIHSESYRFTLPLQTTHPKISPYILEADGHASIDLTQATIDELVRLGVRESTVIVSEIDTCTSANHFSHVRETKNNEVPGRLATVFALVD